jgi:hypothetical protein
MSDTPITETPTDVVETPATEIPTDTTSVPEITVPEAAIEAAVEEIEEPLTGEQGIGQGTEPTEPETTQE